MRDTLLSLIVATLLIVTLRHPFVGALTWTWLGTMNPHRLSFGFAYAFPFAAIAAGVTVFSWLFSREPKRLPNHPLLWLLLAWLVWITVTTAFALFQDEAWQRWREVMKVHAMTLVILAMLTTRRRLELLLAVLVASIGFFSVKGGAWVLTGAFGRVWGPPDSMIEDNNYLAVATTMIIPLMRYFQQRSNQRWVRLLLAGAMALSVASVLGSYSRSGLIAFVVMTMFLFWKSRRRILLALVFGSLLAGLIAFMPDRWEQRMSTIQNYEEDESARSRLLAWQTMFNLAKDHPLVGGGFGVDNEQIYRQYGPDPSLRAYVAHSIYFQALGEQGFVGLALVLALLIGSWIVAGRLSHEAEIRGEDWRWASDMARLIQVSLSGFVVGGVFLNLLHFDFYYYLIASLIALASIVRGPGKDNALDPNSGGRRL
jgi:probable O-glycosylation ligase (exosortase A-associated)